MARLLVFDGFVFISGLVFFGYLLGLNKFLTKHGDNGCDMTYMYEYPQFVRVSLPLNVTAEYRRYGLYAYSEGRHTQLARNMQFSGIPVLFIPGQGGSLKQVRSLASVSLRKALSSDLPFHFDFFTLDLNEEYSAMFGGVLTDQTRFAVHAVQRILALYKRGRPDSIILIGHSMGGMIAKGLFLEPDFPSSSVQLVVTLATPHSPVVLTDPLLRDYYQRVSPPGSNVTVVSLGGGVKDLVVRSGLTLTTGADISALTTAVSEVWMSVDHLCILWCKQLVLVIVRAMFDSVDLRTLQISKDPDFRLSVFKYHLLERSAGKRFHESVHPTEASLQTTRSEWLELTRPRHSLHRPSLRFPLHLLLHLPSSAEDTLAVTTLGHKSRDWLFACSQLTVTNDGHRVCTTVENLSSLGRIAPTKQQKHKVALVNLQELRARGLRYVVVRLPPTDEPTTVNYDMFSAIDRSITVALPRWQLPLQWTTLVPATTPDAAFYTLELPQLQSAWQAYHLNVGVTACSNTSHQAVATLRVPWSSQHSSKVLRNSDEIVLPIMLHTPRPADWSGPVPYVILHLDPKCQYSFQIQNSAIESLAQLVRLYSTQLVAYVAAILLLTIRQQLLSLSTHQHCLLFHHALLEGAKPYWVLPAVNIASNTLGWRLFPEWLRVLLPRPDHSTLAASGLDFMLLPLFLYCVAFALTFLLGLLGYVGIVFSGSTINKFALKFVGKLAGVSRTWTDWLMAAIDKVPCVVSAAMVAILLSSCGGLAMLIGAIYYFMRVCGMYEDYIEQLFFAPVKYFKDSVMAKWKGRQLPAVDDIVREAEELLSLKGLTEFNFHLTLVMLWGTATIVHLPSVLVWAHNFKYNPVLDPDPATNAAMVSSVCAAVLWSLNTPICSESREMYKQMSNILFVLAALVLVYCPISVYNVPVLVATVLVCLTLHQLCEWAAQRWAWQTAEASDNENETEDDKAAIENTVDSDEGESSLNESDKSASENISRKNSRASEVSMSSYEAVSLAELKVNEGLKEKMEQEESEEEEEEEEEEVEEVVVNKEEESVDEKEEEGSVDEKEEEGSVDEKEEEGSVDEKEGEESVEEKEDEGERVEQLSADKEEQENEEEDQEEVGTSKDGQDKNQENYKQQFDQIAKKEQTDKTFLEKEHQKPKPKRKYNGEKKN